MSTLPIEEAPLLADRPLFGLGESRGSDRTVHTIIVVITGIFVVITIISGFVPYPTAADMFFVLCILMVCGSHLTLIYWYRLGDLDPKFKKLIYYNTLFVILLCICANIFMH